MATGNPMFEAQLEHLLEKIAKGARGCAKCGKKPSFVLDIVDYAPHPTVKLRCPDAAHPACAAVPKPAAGFEAKVEEIRNKGLSLVDFWNDHHAIPLPGKPGGDVL